MPGKTGSSLRLGSICSLPLAGLLVVFFFLPWVSVSCETPMGKQTVATATGWELTMGELSPAKGVQQPSGDPPGQSKPGEGVKARPWFILGLVVPGLVAAAGAFGLSGAVSRAGSGMLLVLLGLAGIVVMVLAACVDYSDEMAKKGTPTGGPMRVRPSEGTPPEFARGMEQMGEQMAGQLAGKSLKTEAGAIVWVGLGLYVLVGGCGVADLVLRASGRGPVTAQIGPGPGGPGPPVG